MVSITFSWDDGAMEDIKLLHLLEKYSIPSIFFIPAQNHERPVLNKNDILKISESGQEVGAHTFSHAFLTKIDKENVFKELNNGKLFLENIIGKEVKHFCLPGGFYNNTIINQSLKLFSTVRTAKSCCIRPTQQIINPTFHFFNRGYKSLLYHSIKNSPLLLELLLKNSKNYNYFDFIKITLDQLSQKNNFYDIHIWGHSWEIEKEQLWEQLDDFLFFISTYHKQSCYPYSM